MTKVFLESKGLPFSIVSLFGSVKLATPAKIFSILKKKGVKYTKKEVYDSMEALRLDGVLIKVDSRHYKVNLLLMSLVHHFTGEVYSDYKQYPVKSKSTSTG